MEILSTFKVCAAQIVHVLGCRSLVMINLTGFFMYDGEEQPLGDVDARRALPLLPGESQRLV